MIVLRLTRVGKRKQPSYRLVAQDKQRDPWGPALDIMGSYNPRTKALTVKKDRIEHWISKGAQMSPSVNNLLLTNGIIKGEKMKTTTGDKDKTKSAPAAAAEEKPAA
jgi:small subunit ribosomal protein S16